ncbi:MAG TPA: hypothetical protein VFN35_05775, partial [Ktedonobacteraceae bacterium]|nr:hypothetical protein [Ktedonobacteraceae bacterium]
IGHRSLYTMLNDGQESTKEDHSTESCLGRKGKENERNERMIVGKDSARISQVHSHLAMSTDRKNETL